MAFNRLARSLMVNLRRSFRSRFRDRKWLKVIINPAAGQVVPDLRRMNRIIHSAGMEWELEITNTFGDGARIASKAVAEGASIVAACGGDGTVMDVAAGLLGSDVPLALLPSGTGNVVSKEFNIPQDLTAAVNLMVNPETEKRPFDLGLAGNTIFLLRLGVGLEAEIVRKSDREAKDRLGMLAYGAAILQSWGNTPPAQYQLTLDGEKIEIEGLAVMVANAGALGVPGLSLPPHVRVDDGLLDVFVIRRTDLMGVAAVVQAVTGAVAKPAEIPHWHAREISITADPPQGIEADGESLGDTPVQVKVLPSALHVLVPTIKNPS